MQPGCTQQSGGGLGESLGHRLHAQTGERPPQRGIVDPRMDHLHQHRGGGDHREVRVTCCRQPLVPPDPAARPSPVPPCPGPVHRSRCSRSGSVPGEPGPLRCHGADAHPAPPRISAAGSTWRPPRPTSPWLFTVRSTSNTAACPAGSDDAPAARPPRAAGWARSATDRCDRTDLMRGSGGRSRGQGRGCRGSRAQAVPRGLTSPLGTTASGTNINTAMSHIGPSYDNSPSAPAVATRTPQSESVAAHHAGQVRAAPRP